MDSTRRGRKPVNLGENRPNMYYSIPEIFQPVCELTLRCRIHKVNTPGFSMVYAGFNPGEEN
jgi:hypothetical protein